jgi:hypothetical protein
MTSNAMKILRKKRENALLEKIQSHFGIFFLVRLSLNDPLLGSTVKKKNVLYIF